MTGARLKHYGWGREGEGMTEAEQAFVLGRYRAKFSRDKFETIAVPRLEDIALRAPRVMPPPSLAAFCVTDRYDRAAHAYGKSYPDYVRAMLGDYDCAPDVVAYPRSEAEISAVMDWAGGVNASLTPFGGGSSVCGGVEPRADGVRYKAAVTLDLRHLDKVVEVDQASRAALIEGGAYGPSLENQLKPHGLTLRHFPQSFEYSTLGGWIATRSGGHFASLYTHIDDFVENLRVVTPRGILETRRLPGSGAGPSPDRLLIGSEGNARRDHARPGCGCSRARNSAPARPFGSRVSSPPRVPCAPSHRRGFIHRTAASSTRRRPSTPVPPTAASPSWCSALNPVIIRLDAWMARALECCTDHGGTPEAAKAGDAHLEGAAGIWRNAFIRMPYAREFLTPAGLINDTFETAITWDRFESVPRQGEGGDGARDPGGDRRPGRGHLPLHPCLSGRPGALLLLPRAGSSRRAPDAVAGDQERRERRADRGRRHHHPSPCGRPRSSPVVRPPAAGAFRGSASRGETGHSIRRACSIRAC